MPCPSNFNPRSPWGERQSRKKEKALKKNFNPRSPWGERHLLVYCRRCHTEFQSTLPVGGATVQSVPIFRGGPDFNPRSPWGERPAWAAAVGAGRANFNPRSPWGERQTTNGQKKRSSTFQSTLPVGGATVWQRGGGVCRFQSTLPVGGATSPRPGVHHGLGDFNPRSPWGERRFGDGVGAWLLVFQSTLPVGGATPTVPFAVQYIPISIHAPRGGSDSKDAQFYLRIFGEKVNFECYFVVNSRYQPVP